MSRCIESFKLISEHDTIADANRYADHIRNLVKPARVTSAVKYGSSYELKLMIECGFVENDTGRTWGFCTLAVLYEEGLVQLEDHPHCIEKGKFGDC